MRSARAFRLRRRVCGNALRVMAALRNLVIFVVAQEAEPKETRPEVMERMAARLAEALQALDLPLLQ